MNLNECKTLALALAADLKLSGGLAGSKTYSGRRLLKPTLGDFFEIDSRVQAEAQVNGYFKCSLCVSFDSSKSDSPLSVFFEWGKISWDFADVAAYELAKPKIIKAIRNARARTIRVWMQIARAERAAEFLETAEGAKTMAKQKENKVWREFANAKAESYARFYAMAAMESAMIRGLARGLSNKSINFLAKMAFNKTHTARLAKWQSCKGDILSS